MDQVPKILSALIHGDADCWNQTYELKQSVFPPLYSRIFNILRSHYVATGTYLTPKQFKSQLLALDIKDSHKKRLAEVFVECVKTPHQGWSVADLMVEYKERVVYRGLKVASESMTKGHTSFDGTYYGGVQGVRNALAEMEKALDMYGEEDEVDDAKLRWLRMKDRSDSPTLDLGIVNNLVRILRGELWLFSGFPGDGKTTKMLNMTASALIKGEQVLIISLEATPHKLRWKLACILSYMYQTPVEYEAVVLKKLSEEKEKIFLNMLELTNRVVIKKAGELFELTSILQRYPDATLVFVDHLGMVSARSKDYFNAIGEGLKTLVRYVKNHDSMVMIVLNQTNRRGYERAVEQGAYTLTALADSNEAERAPDGVMWILKTGFLTSRLGVAKRRELVIDTGVRLEMTLDPHTHTYLAAARPTVDTIDLD